MKFRSKESTYQTRILTTKLIIKKLIASLLGDARGKVRETTYLSVDAVKR